LLLACVEFDILQCRRKNGPARRESLIQERMENAPADVGGLRLSRQRLAAKCVINCDRRAYLLTWHKFGGNGLQHCGSGTFGQQSTVGIGGHWRVVWEVAIGLAILNPWTMARVWADCPMSVAAFDDWMLLARSIPATPEAGAAVSRRPDATTDVPSKFWRLSPFTSYFMSVSE